jgi:hypothetical protein
MTPPRLVEAAEELLILVGLSHPGRVPTNRAADVEWRSPSALFCVSRISAALKAPPYGFICSPASLNSTVPSAA